MAIYQGKHASRRTEKNMSMDYSKLCTRDIRPLLWVVTLGGLVLAFYSIYRGFMGSLPWIGAMVGLPWTAYGTVCSFYLSMAKSDHSEGGITYESAKANGFQIQTESVLTEQDDGNWESPRI